MNLTSLGGNIKNKNKKLLGLEPPLTPFGQLWGNFFENRIRNIITFKKNTISKQPKNYPKTTQKTFGTGSTPPTFPP